MQLTAGLFFASMLLMGLLSFDSFGYDHTTEFDSENIEQYDELSQGVQLYENGQYLKAIIIFDKILTNEPDSVKALSYKGACLGALWEIDESLEFLDKALEINPNYVDALAFKAGILLTQEKFDEVNSLLTRVLETDPHNKYALVHKGNTEAGIGNYEISLQYLNKALELYPNQIEALGSLAVVESVLGNYESAKLYLDHASEINPDHLFLLFSKAVASSLAYQDEKAIEFIDQAVDLYPDHPSLLSIKSIFLANLGEDQLALDISRKAANLNSQDPFILSALSFLEMINGQNENSASSINRALEINQNHLSSLIMKSILLQYEGDFDESSLYVDKALEINPNHPDVLYIRASLFANIGSLENALGLIDKILEINPNHVRGLLYKALILSESNDEHEQVKSLVARVTQLNPDYPGVFHTQGIIFHAIGDYDKAVEYYDRFLAKYPDDQLTLNAKKAALKEVQYSGFRFDGDPIVCGIEPDSHKTIPNLTEKMFSTTHSALYLWQKALRDAPGNHGDWNIYFQEIHNKDLKEFDIQKNCDVIIEYKQKNPEFLAGVATFSEKYQKPIIEIYYLKVEYRYDFLQLKDILTHTSDLSLSANLVDTIKHEFGHVMGLPHYPVSEELKQSISNGDKKSPSLMTADRLGKLTITTNDVNNVIAIYGEDGFGSSKNIPNWIKNTAGWWVEGKIDDDTYIDGVKFLVKEGIVKIPVTNSNILQNPNDVVPSWIKLDTDEWNKGLTSDSMFTNGVSYLIKMQ